MTEEFTKKVTGRRVAVTFRYACGCIDSDARVLESFSLEGLSRMARTLGDYTVVKCSLSYVPNPSDEELGIDVFLGESCSCCRKTQEYKSNHKPDSILQGSVYCHGLDTGFGGSHLSVQGIVGNMLAIPRIERAGREICCSWKSQPLGSCGFYVVGDVTVAANRDVRSFVNGLGERIVGDDSCLFESLFERREQLDLTAWGHTEFFVIPHVIKGLWIKDWFVDAEPRILEAANIIADGMGVKVYILHDRQ